VKNNKKYLLFLLTVIVTFNYTDRFALGLVLQDIKGDLGLSDSELGILSGIAFAFFYSIMGLPIARWADTGNRVTIIGLATILWSVAVAACGVAANFVQLLLIRVIVGVGEAGCVPPALSLIADRFSRAERPRAVSLYMQGVSASVVLGYFAAGWLNQLCGWRAMFVIIGLPGVLLAAAARFSLREPRRDTPATITEPSAHPSLRSVGATLFASVTFRHLLYANSVMWFMNYGTMQWTPSFFIRSFGLGTGELGTWFAVIYGISGVLGTYWGGEWAARRASRNERLQLKVMAGLISVSGILMALVYLPALAPNAYIAFGWLGLSNLAGAMTNGPIFSVIQTLVPGRMRATAVAIIFLFANLIGIGLGPWTAGALSDALRPWFGADSLRYSMLVLCPTVLWGAWHLWIAARSITQEVNPHDGDPDIADQGAERPT